MLEKSFYSLCEVCAVNIFTKNVFHAFVC
jgi:hypothetical protein